MKINLSSHKVLLVEDYPIMRAAMKEMLYQFKAQVIVETSNANFALAAMNKEKFDIVLCDFNLGTGKNGQQLLEEAKLRKLLPYTAIFIMVTAEQTQSMVLSVMDNKPDDYLTKPFNAQQLISRIEKHLNRKAFFANIEKALEKDNLPSAIAYCDELLLLNQPQMRIPLIKLRTELAIKAGDLLTAEKLYREVLAQRELAWARHGLGVVALMQNNLTLAIEHFQQALSYAPMMMEIYDGLANAHAQNGNPEESKQVLINAVELSPQAILRQQKLAYLADQMDDLDVARQAYKAAIKLGEFSVHKSSKVCASLARVYCRTNETKEAQKVIANLRKNFQNDPEAELRAAAQEFDMYSTLGNTALAAEAYNRIEKFTPKLPSPPNDLALEIAKTHYKNGHSEKADTMLEVLVKNNVDDEQFIGDLRQMYKTLGRDGNGEQLINRSKQELIDINNAGVGLFKQGKVLEALALLDAAAEKLPENRTIALNIAVILIQDMKKQGTTREKLLKTNNCIKKITSLGGDSERINHVKTEFAKLALASKN